MRAANNFHLLRLAAVALLLLPATPSPASKKSKPAPAPAPADPLARYLKQEAAATAADAPASRGSLFTSNGVFADPYGDVKAHRMGDTIAVQIVESTTIAQSGSVATSRDFSHSSAVTGIGGQAPSFLNPLLAMNSATKRDGTGTTASQSSLNTTLTALVIGVLPNGLLVVEASRQVLANSQHENVTLRGVVRPADISANNTIFSYQLFDLQLEVKGKGVISDTVREPNPVIRALMRIFSF